MQHQTPKSPRDHGELASELFRCSFVYAGTSIANREVYFTFLEVAVFYFSKPIANCLYSISEHAQVPPSSWLLI